MQRDWDPQLIRYDYYRIPAQVLPPGTCSLALGEGLSGWGGWGGRGSLFRLLHMPRAKEFLKEDRRMRMAMDVVTN